MEHRFDAQEKALHAAIEAQGAALTAALNAQHLAMAKIDATLEARFESVRSEVFPAIERNSERLEELSVRVRDSATKAEIIASFEAQAGRVRELSERVTTAEGKRAGLHTGWTYLIALMTVIGVLLSAYFAIH
jgi:hypothetical protein